MSFYALWWTALGLLIGTLAAKHLFDVDAGLFFCAVLGCLAGRAVRAWYRDEGRAIDGDCAPGPGA